MSREHEATQAAVETLIRAGKGAEGRSLLLARLSGRRPPRPYLARYAQLGLRLGFPGVGLRLLHPLVRPERTHASPTPEEAAEYAACLVHVGASEEALRVLDGLDPHRTPRANFYRAAALVSQWDYPRSIPCLRAYLESPALSSYDRLVAKVNLAAALVFDRRHLHSRYLIRELIHEASLGRNTLVLGRALEIAAEDCLVRREWKEAGEFLDRAARLLTDSAGSDLLVVEKYRAALGALRSNGSEPSLKPLAAVRENAARAGRWETARDCDRLAALALGDAARVAHLFYGTPFPGFRARLLADLPACRVPASYDWAPGPRAESAPILDLESGEIAGSQARLPIGQAPHRLLAALATDFYRPFRVATLFERVNPDELFHPLYSAQRMHQAASRLRKWIRAARLPLDVRVTKAGFRVTANGPVVLRLHRDQPPILERLLGASPIPLSKRQIAATLGVSPRAALRAIGAGLHEGRILAVGRSSATRYVLRPASPVERKP